MPQAGLRGGGRWRDHRQVVNGLMWKLATGAQWRRDLPERYGPWQTVYERFSRRRHDGLRPAPRPAAAQAERRRPHRPCIDSTSVQASRSAVGAPKGGGPEEPDDHALGLSRGGIGTKIHPVTDGSGLPLAFSLTAGQRQELTAFERTLKAVRLSGPRGRPRACSRQLAGDKAYIYRPVFAYLRPRRIRPVIPLRQSGHMGQGCPHTFDPDLYRRRNAIERCVEWMKSCRSIATRQDKLAVNFEAMAQLAFLRQYLRTLRPSDRT